MTTNPYLINPHLPGEPFNLEASGPNAVLLFHGLTATCAEVTRLGRILNRAGFATAGPMLPGHGINPGELNKVRWKDWIATGEAEYQKLAGRYQRVFIGGESTGALVALYLAAEHPEIAGVLAYAPALRLALTRWQRITLHLIAPFIASLPKIDQTRYDAWQGYDVITPRSIIQLMRLQDQARARLPQICQPALIVQGRQDHTIDPRSAEIVYTELGAKDKELHWMEHSRHCVLLDGEQHIVTRLTMDFLFRVIAK